MKLEITYELIFDHFARKTSPLQRNLIEEWLKDEANEELYYQWLEEWEKRHPQYLAESDEALTGFTSFIKSNPHDDLLDEEEITEQVSEKNNRRRMNWLIAASIVLLIGLTAFIFQDKIIYQNYQTTFGETQSLVLPDGSKVTLNSNSSLRLLRWGFGQTNREVFLNGEANFSVKHTVDNQKFIVKSANNFEVVVLGTEFTVYARKRGSKVILNKGKVQLRYQEGKQSKNVMMKPGELLTLDRHNHIQIKETAEPQAYSAWEEKRFVFEETTLEEVAYLLEENYGLQVEIKGSELSKRVLMGSFRAENVDELLKSISELLNINVVRQGTHVQLSEY